MSINKILIDVWVGFWLVLLFIVGFGVACLPLLVYFASERQNYQNNRFIDTCTDRGGITRFIPSGSKANPYCFYPESIIYIKQE